MHIQISTFLMNSETGITIEQFLQSSRQFCVVSDRLGDGWILHENINEIQKSYVKKLTYTQHEENEIQTLLKAEFVIFYNLSYSVPSFSFNIWNSSGVLLTLEDIRKMSFININEKDFYSVITQQEHPIFSRPYFVMHPCHTATLLSEFKETSKNIIVTFLSLITPLLKLNLALEYGI